MGTDWEDLTGWWSAEVADDPAYRNQVLPMLVDLLAPTPGSRYLDTGCGDGSVMQAVAARGGVVIGCDLSLELLSSAAREGPVVRCRLPGLQWIRPGSFDGAFASLVLEHLPDLEPLFGGLSDAVRPGGPLAVVINHPLYTAPGSGPVVDPTDGELFWRWGNYLVDGSTEEPAGDQRVTFFHRPLSGLLNSAAAAGWSLVRSVEQSVAGTPEDRLLLSQSHIPRLLGLRWIRARG